MAPNAKTFVILTALALSVNLFLPLGCGPGWEGYEDRYSDAGPIPSEPWDGPQSVFVAFEDMNVEVFLEGMETCDFHGAPAVRLSELIIKSGLTNEPENFRYDFTATDGYNLFIKRHDDLSLLPGWDEMKSGYLYEDARYDDLAAGWTEHPWGSALSAYQIKLMDAGTITLLSPDAT